MAGIRSFSLAAAAVLVLASASVPSHAFAAAQTSLEGTWNIVNWVTRPRIPPPKNQHLRDHTEYSGQLVIQKGKTANQYTGEMNVVCTNCNPQTSATERMTITLGGATVTLRGAVLSSSSGRYTPDNLVLTVDGNFLTGTVSDPDSLGEIRLRKQAQSGPLR
jgi:hypothetical protein